MQPRVSVILNCRNGADFLNQAIDSLLAQTFEDWELVAWDDGSTDDSQFILKSYHDKRIRLFSSPSSDSLSRVRALAIRQCCAEWIAFLDQDDVWLPDKLARQVKLADQYPGCGLIYGRAIRFRGKAGIRDHRHEWTPLPEGQIFERLLIDSCFICMSTAMIRKSALAKIDPIPPHVRLAPDYYLYLALALQFEARAIQEPVCLYREHENNLSCRLGRELQFECIRLINQFSPWMDSNLARWRRRVHNSLIAFSDMCSLATFAQGFDYLRSEGSIRYLASRPFIRCYRQVKRWFVRPYWREACPTMAALFSWRDLGTKTAATSATAAAATTRTGPKRFQFLGTEISTGSFLDAQTFLASMVEQRVAGYICNANAYSLMYSRDVYRHQRATARASYVSADGMPVVWMLRALGQPAERVHGDDLFFACCERFPKWRHFLVGGKEGQGRLVADELRRRYPGINVVGFRSTPTRPPSAAETSSLLQEIHDAEASIVWVGMGTPSQDYWMSYAAALAGVPMAGVGSSFDVLAGFTEPAPDWMKRSGLQWVFRLLQEPRRLAKRYLYYNSRFLLAALIELVTLRRHAIRSTTAEDLRQEHLMTKTADLSVVIVTYNSGAFIEACLDAVFATTVGLEVEVFVVDSGSTDGTADLVAARYSAVTLIRDSNIGFSAANNRALPLCTGRRILLLNPDTVVQEGAITALLDYMDRHADLGAVGARLQWPDGRIQDHCAHNLPTAWNMLLWLFLLDQLELRLRFGGRRTRSETPPHATLFDGFALRSWTRDRSTEVEYLSGASLMMRREVLDRVGLLDAASPLYLDDIDYCRRILDAGWKLHYVSEAVITHYWQQSSSSLKREADFFALLCHSIWIYLRKHEGKTAAHVFCMGAFAAGSIRLVFCSVAGWLTGSAGKQSWQRRVQMSEALLRWSLRFPKAPPSLNFVPQAVAPISEDLFTAGKGL